MFNILLGLAAYIKWNCCSLASGFSITSPLVFWLMCPLADYTIVFLFQITLPRWWHEAGRTLMSGVWWSLSILVVVWLGSDRSTRRQRIAQSEELTGPNCRCRSHWYLTTVPVASLHPKNFYRQLSLTHLIGFVSFRNFRFWNIACSKRKIIMHSCNAFQLLVGPSGPAEELELRRSNIPTFFLLGGPCWDLT